ncbi:GyrI-like domain-containing protein [Longitalea arenae]|uniref:GyrI-like domain-containing protein n=1 Tax=Longitalea arenae TaxID=2812558 RepID=UPI0019670FDC|nr:GyrI-like domain-containing protein [Longitalea arenae]
MHKLDLTKTYKAYFTAKVQPELVNIESARFISIQGKGDPSGPAFADNIAALYAMAYTIKFMYKAQNNDFVVSKLEALWWFDDNKYKSTSIETAPTEIPRSEWEYRLLIRMPEFVTVNDIDTAREIVRTKKNRPLAEQVSYFRMTEGKSIQVLHIGPFSTEPETLKKIAAFSELHKLAQNGLHHEIYLSDFRKTPPEKLRTILREPVK